MFSRQKWKAEIQAGEMLVTPQRKEINEATERIAALERDLAAALLERNALADALAAAQAKNERLAATVETMRRKNNEVHETLAAAQAEVERLKTVPMKYRRMEHNARLEKERDEARAEAAALRVGMEALLRDASMTLKDCVRMWVERGSPGTAEAVRRVAARVDAAIEARKEGV